MTKILLVDDSPVDRRLYTKLLEHDSDFDVTTCSDGAEAIKAMGTHLPRVVVADVQMPKMDGLELVQKAKKKFPNIPVILITGHGSEALATKALKAGAAGYVPKSNSGESLVATVQHVLDLVHHSEVDRRIRQMTNLVQYELSLENDETLIPGVLQLARQRMTDCGTYDPGALLQVGVAMEQAILNAIYHGNLEFKQFGDVEFDKQSRQKEASILVSEPPYNDRRVKVEMRITPEEARFVVRDEGRGFDVKELAALGLTQSLRGEFGQGLFLMWSFMDKVVFDQTGNCVNLIKKASSESAKKSNSAGTQSGASAGSNTDQDSAPLLMLRNKDGGEDYAITKERITIGRDGSCDMAVGATSVSHHHCILYLHEGWWFVQDLKSRNGTKVNGARIESHLVPPNATLTVGYVDFKADYQPHKLGAIGVTPPVNPF